MTSGLQTNLDKVIKAIEIYQNIVTKKSDEAAKKKMGDLAFRAASNTYYTSAGIIASDIANLPNKNDGGKKRYGNQQYVGQYKLINWQRKLNGLDPRGGSVYASKNRADPKRKRNKAMLAGLGKHSFMDGKYKKFIQSRRQSIKFIRAAWGVAAAFFGKPFERGNFGPGALARFSGKGYGGGDIKYGKDIAEYSMFNGAGRFDTRGKTPVLRSASDQNRASAIIEEALNKGAEETLADINVYFEKHIDRIEKYAQNLNQVK